VKKTKIDLGIKSKMKKTLLTLFFCLVLSTILISCNNDETEVYTENILGFWNQVDREVDIKTTDIAADSLLIKYYNSKEDKKMQIFSFERDRILSIYEDKNDTVSTTTTYILNEDRIALAGIQGSCKITIKEDTLSLIYDATDYITEGDFKGELVNAGYVKPNDVQLQKKIYKWRYQRIDNPFQSE